jgi:hypothetical protein
MPRNPVFLLGRCDCTAAFNLIGFFPEDRRRGTTATLCCGIGKHRNSPGTGSSAGIITAEAHPIANMTEEAVKYALEEAIKRDPSNRETDNGGKFHNKHRETYRSISKELASALVFVAETETPSEKLRNIPNLSHILSRFRPRDMTQEVAETMLRDPFMGSQEASTFKNMFSEMLSIAGPRQPLADLGKEPQVG